LIYTNVIVWVHNINIMFVCLHIWSIKRLATLKLNLIWPLYTKICLHELHFDLCYSTETVCMNFELNFITLLGKRSCLVDHKYICKRNKNNRCCKIIYERDHCNIRNFNSNKIFN
jgi:hypothetical protein